MALWQLGLSAAGGYWYREKSKQEVRNTPNYRSQGAGGTCRAQCDVLSLSFMHFPAFGHMGSAGGAQGSDNSHLPRSSSHLLITSSSEPRGSSPRAWGMHSHFPREGWNGLSFGFKPDLDWPQQSHSSVPHLGSFTLPQILRKMKLSLPLQQVVLSSPDGALYFGLSIKYLNFS